MGAEEGAKQQPVRDASASGDEAGLALQLRRVAKNLLALEVNTIFKENITATHVPSASHALIDIVNDYDATLRELGAAPAGQTSGTASLAVFDELRVRASAIHEGDAGARREGVDYGPSTLLMLCRIRDNCDQLKGIFQALEHREGAPPVFTRSAAPHVTLVPVEVMTIRKIWEIGTEEIAMQTVIQLDGDVVTRLQRAYARVKDDPVIAVHNSAVATSVGTWNRLVDTLGAFMSGAAHLFLGK
jgi:hypothetical protein